MNLEMPKCDLCGEPMPVGESMFKYHGFSGACPKPPLSRGVNTIDMRGIQEPNPKLVAEVVKALEPTPTDTPQEKCDLERGH